MELDAFLYMTVALFGLIIGSFANVVIWRVPRGESVAFPGSHCPSCNMQIAWYDNIPVVSWLILGRKCRSCAAPISSRYPLVELLSGLLCLSAALRFGFTPQAFSAAVFFYMLLILTFIDWDTMRLPNPIVGTLFGLGILGAVVSQIWHVGVVPVVPLGTGVFGQPLAVAVIGAVASAGVALAIAAAYASVRHAQGFGMGDVKLLAAIGVFLGPYGLMALFLGSVLGAIYGIWLSVIRRMPPKAVKFPFGPFLAIGAVLTALVGPGIWAAYLGLLS